MSISLSAISLTYDFISSFEVLRPILETTRHLLSKCDGRVIFAAILLVWLTAVPLLYDDGLGLVIPMLVDAVL